MGSCHLTESGKIFCDEEIEEEPIYDDDDDDVESKTDSKQETEIETHDTSFTCTSEEECLNMNDENEDEEMEEHAVYDDDDVESITDSYNDDSKQETETHDTSFTCSSEEECSNMYDENQDEEMEEHAEYDDDDVESTTDSYNDDSNQEVETYDSSFTCSSEEECSNKYDEKAEDDHGENNIMLEKKGNNNDIHLKNEKIEEKVYNEHEEDERMKEEHIPQKEKESYTIDENDILKFIRAAANKNKLIVEEYISRYPPNTIIHSEDKNGWQAIHEAARVDDVNLIKLLLKAGADINKRSNFNKGGTPLYWAIEINGGSHNVVTFLKENGAKIIRPKL